MARRASIMRSLGRFVGEIGKAVASPPPPSPPPSPPPPGERREVSRRVEEEQRETPQGRVTLRRTTIEEIEIEPGAGDEDEGVGGR